MSSEEKEEEFGSIDLNEIAKREGLFEFAGKWVLLIDGRLVYNDHDEAAIYRYADEHFPDKVPCILKIPERGISLTFPNNALPGNWSLK